jgi:hypothetical protein
MASSILDSPLASVDAAREGLAAGLVTPYLGPGISALQPQPVPMSPEALAGFFASKVALPKRAVGNAWAAAQFIESRKFRNTVTALMREAFASPVAPSAFHQWLAG